MSINILKKFFFLLLLVVSVVSCKKDDDEDMMTNDNGWTYDPTFTTLDVPPNLPPPPLPQDNPLTEEGIKLGRMLFFDPILSGDSTLACAGCHNPQFAFSDDNKRYSKGIDGIEGDRNSMALFNLTYAQSFFWDGRAATLEDQILEPVPNPIEMHEEWPDAVEKLSNHSEYPRLFYEAFGEETITKELAAKSVSQFLRTVISVDSRWDKNLRQELSGTGQELTDAELRGFEVFKDETAGDCFHCHNWSSGLFQDVDQSLQFRNNGLDFAASINDFEDPGLGGITNDPNDYGKFKVPSLRNVEYTAPYMHDGRFQTLEEVVDFYSDGIQQSPTIDPVMEKPNRGGLTQQQKNDLVAFLKTLTDEEYVNNPDYANPF